MTIVIALVHFPGKNMAGELVHDYILAITLGHKAAKDQRWLKYDCGYGPTGLSCNSSVN